MKTDKKSDKKLGKLRSLVHKHDSYYIGSHTTEVMLTRLDKMIQSYSVCNTGFGVERYKAYVEMKKLVLELELTGDEYWKITAEERLKMYNATPKRNNAEETRDNKGVYVGSGNGEHQYPICKIRYPRKARSKRVWSIFYKMFPSMAEKDGWDGEKSNRTK